MNSDKRQCLVDAVQSAAEESQYAYEELHSQQLSLCDYGIALDKWIKLREKYASAARALVLFDVDSNALTPRQDSDLVNTCAEICYLAQCATDDEEHWGDQKQGNKRIADVMSVVAYIVFRLMGQNHDDTSIKMSLNEETLIAPLSLTDWKRLLLGKVASIKHQSQKQ